MSWTQYTALVICRRVEEIAPLYDCHAGLTGGCLYKDGERKDLDLIFYPDKNSSINLEALFEALDRNKILKLEDKRPLSERHWLYRAKDLSGRRIDCFFYYSKQGYGEDGAGNYT